VTTTSANGISQVRPCGLRDVSAVSRLLKASWHSAHDHIIGRHRAIRLGRRVYSKFNLGILIARSKLFPHAAKMFAAVRGQEVAGFAMAQLDGEREIVLYMLYVHPELKGQGIGSELLRAVIACHPNATAVRVEVLQGNIEAIEWYKLKGFEVYGETKSATGTADVAAFYMDKGLDVPAA